MPALVLAVLVLSGCTAPAANGPRATRAAYPSLAPYPRQQQEETSTVIINGAGRRGQQTTFATEDQPEQVWAFYRDTLTATGWKAIHQGLYVNGQGCPNYTVSITVQAAAGDMTQVKVISSNEPCAVR